MKNREGYRRKPPFGGLGGFAGNYEDKQNLKYFQ